MQESDTNMCLLPNTILYCVSTHSPKQAYLLYKSNEDKDTKNVQHFLTDKKITLLLFVFFVRDRN